MAWMGIRGGRRIYLNLFLLQWLEPWRGTGLAVCEVGRGGGMVVPFRSRKNETENQFSSFVAHVRKAMRSSVGDDMMTPVSFKSGQTDRLDNFIVLIFGNRGIHLPGSRPGRWSHPCGLGTLEMTPHRMSLSCAPPRQAPQA